MVSPGWYPDPDDAEARRYWDGANWSAPLKDQPVDPGTSMAGPPSPSWVATHRLVLALVGVVVVALAVTAYFVFSSGPTMTVSGEVDFTGDQIDANSVGSIPDDSGNIECNGMSGSGLTIGDPVQVKVSGDVVATGTLDEGTYDQSTDTCTMTFTIRGVPADEDDYDVLVGDSNPVNFTKQEMIDGPSICRGDAC